MCYILLPNQILKHQCRNIQILYESILLVFGQMKNHQVYLLKSFVFKTQNLIDIFISKEFLLYFCLIFHYFPWNRPRQVMPKQEWTKNSKDSIFNIGTRTGDVPVTALPKPTDPRKKIWWKSCITPLLRVRPMSNS